MNPDGLGLSRNPDVLSMLGKYGPGESVCFSVSVIKINRRGKKQTRALMCTAEACYNLKPGKESECQRRITWRTLDTLFITAEVVDMKDFVLHVPSEYDYHFRSEKAEEICNSIAELFLKATGRVLPIEPVPVDQMAVLIDKAKKRMYSTPSYDDGPRGPGQRAAAGARSRQRSEAAMTSSVSAAPVWPRVGSEGPPIPDDEEDYPEGFKVAEV